MVPEQVENARRGPMPMCSPHPSHGPFAPHQGDGQEQQGTEVGDHERPTAVLGRLDRKAQVISQAHGVARHGQHEPQPRVPPVATMLFHEDPFRPYLEIRQPQ